MEGLKIPGLPGRWRHVEPDDYAITPINRRAHVIQEDPCRSSFFVAVTPEWRTLPAGPELDQVLSDVVFGEGPAPLCNYSVDVGDAFLVVEEMRRRGYGLEITIERSVDTVAFSMGEEHHVWKQITGCIAEAICRAALLAKEYEA